MLEAPARDFPARLRDHASYYAFDLPGSVKDDLLEAANRIEALTLDPIFAFLLGEAALDLPDDAERRTGGSYAWFGDDVRPAYWWRKRLRSVVNGEA